MSVKPVQKKKNNANLIISQDRAGQRLWPLHNTEIIPIGFLIAAEYVENGSITGKS